MSLDETLYDARVRATQAKLKRMCQDDGHVDYCVHYQESTCGHTCTYAKIQDSSRANSFGVYNRGKQ